MDFDNILYVEYLRYNNYKNEIIVLFEGFYATGGTLMNNTFILIYDLLNISLKPFTSLTATFFEGI